MRFALLLILLSGIGCRGNVSNQGPSDEVSPGDDADSNGGGDGSGGGDSQPPGDVEEEPFNDDPNVVGTVGDPTKVVQLHNFDTGLPFKPELNINAAVDGDDVRVSVLAVAGAKDYRIYALPAAEDIVDLGDDAFAITQATYRCSGLRYLASASLDPTNPATNVAVTSVNGGVLGYTRSESEATLGYLFLEQEPGSIPLYALGSAYQTSDNVDGSADGLQWNASRVKRYTSSQALRDSLIAAGWRNDGVLGYVPSAASADTVQVYEDRRDVSAGTPNRNGAAQTDRPGHVLYFAEGPEANARPDKVPAFLLAKTQGDGQQPLKRVYYRVIPRSTGGETHDELAVGEGNYEILKHQGPTAFPRLLWPGLKETTRFVIEALDATCPYQGHAVSMPEVSGTFGGTERRTFAQMREQSDHQELFINGQGDPNNEPKVLARTVIEADLADKPLLSMKFHADFSDASLFDNLVKTPGNLDDLYSNDQVLFGFIIMNWYSFGIHDGELWVSLSEANGSNGKIRLTPKESVTLSENKYVHATMSVDSVTSGRRYPQFLISDGNVTPPVQTLNGPGSMGNGRTVVIHPFGGNRSQPNWLYVQLCDHRWWDVNSQCPSATANHQINRDGKDVFLPHAELHENFVMFWRNRWDVYVSTKRAYVYFEGAPYLCAILPQELEAGPGAHVTFGTVLYHSGVLPDLTEEPWNTFHHDRELHTSRRQFDNLGFDEKVALPEWNHTIFPCATTFE